MLPRASVSSRPIMGMRPMRSCAGNSPRRSWPRACARASRSEEHTSELQSRGHLVCRLLLETRRSPRSTLFPYTTLFRSDWEYGGYGAPLFDLATLVINNDLNAASCERLLAAYHGHEADAKLRRQFAATVLAARLRESL